MLEVDLAGRNGEICIKTHQMAVKKLRDEEQIKARLRELTQQTRRVREELEQMINRDVDRGRSLSDDRPNRSSRKKK